MQEQIQPEDPYSSSSHFGVFGQKPHSFLPRGQLTFLLISVTLFFIIFFIALGHEKHELFYIGRISWHSHKLSQDKDNSITVIQKKILAVV